MNGNLEPEDRVLREPTLVEQLSRAITTLGWSGADDVILEIGGTSVSGIDVGEEYNKKWQSPLGTRKCNKDAFIIIKNLSRDPFESSKPMDREHKPHHLKTEKELVTEKKESDGRTS